MRSIVASLSEPRPAIERCIRGTHAPTTGADGPDFVSHTSRAWSMAAGCLVGAGSGMLPHCDESVADVEDMDARVHQCRLRHVVVMRAEQQLGRLVSARGGREKDAVGGRCDTAVGTLGIDSTCRIGEQVVPGKVKGLAGGRIRFVGRAVVLGPVPGDRGHVEDDAVIRGG
jgi:hypothetical protein